MKELQVTYTLTDELYSELEKPCKDFNNYNHKNLTIEEFFQFIMCWGCVYDIKDKIEYWKKEYTDNDIKSKVVASGTDADCDRYAVQVQNGDGYYDDDGYYHSFNKDVD